MSSATAKLLADALGYNPGTPAPRSQALAALFGALMGDAFGVPHEFKDACNIPSAEHLQLTMPLGYQKTYSSVPYGTWSDDGSQMLCLLDALAVEGGRLALSTLGAKLSSWYHQALHQSGGTVFDCGGQTRYALLRIADGVTPARAALSQHGDEPDPHSNGNGSLMRVLPAALTTSLWHNSTQDAVRIGAQQSVVTHAHPLSMVTCALYTQLAVQVMQEPFAPGSWVDRALAAARTLESQQVMTRAQQQALADVVRFGRQELPTGAGFVVNSFWSAIYSLDHSLDYIGTLRAAVGLGNDTDTTACIAGGLAALAYGLESVPPDWWAALIIPAETTALLGGLRA